MATNMGAPETSTTAPPLCCEHHGDQKDDKKTEPDKKKHDHLDFLSLKEIKHKPNWAHCASIFYVLFALVLLVVGIAEIVIAATDTSLIQAYNPVTSNRVIGTVILAICAAVAAVAVIVSTVFVCKKNCKALKTVSIILGIIAIIQILLVAFAVTFKNDDMHSLEVSMTESFINASKNHDEANVILWDSLQSGSKCCGLNGPDDYRDPANPYQPKVPLSCCVGYKKNDTDIYNKWQRDLCILNKSYYTDGCYPIMASVFKYATQITVGVTILLIVLEIIVFAIGLSLSRTCSKNHKKDSEVQNTSP